MNAVEVYIREKESQLSRQAPRVNAVVEWLEQRKLENGFGQDFEWTLVHPHG
jgi:hypothetical protein